MTKVLNRFVAYLLLATMVMSVLGGIGSGSVSAAAGLNVTQNNDKAALVNSMLGNGITASNIKLTGHANAFGTFSGGNGIIGFDEGIILSTGKAVDVMGNHQTPNRTTQHNTPGDQNLTDLASLTTLDAAILEFEFVPQGDKISFQYVFSSEEYHEYANDEYNDVFAFFVNGNNAALIPGTTTPVSINNVNGGNPLGTNPKNPQYFIDNVGSSGKQLGTAMDGLTIVMSVSVAVHPGVTNTIKIAIADGGDASYDSNVFIKAGSFNDRAAMPGELVIDSREDFDITIERTTGSDGAISATWTAKDENGATVGTGVVSFNDGETSKTITVPGNTVTIELSNPTNGATIAAGSHSKNLSDISDAGAVLPPTISLNTTEPADSVVVTLSALAGTIEYTTDNGLTWLPYSNPFSVNDNVVLKARAVDQGNFSNEVTYNITNINQKSPAPVIADITAAGTAAEVTVANVPAGATVIVYDGNGVEIGRGTNSGVAAGSVTIEALTEMTIGETISVSLHENNKSESAKVTVTPVFERSAAPLAPNLSANATTDAVTVANVPAGTVVTVYDVTSGNEIGTATNSGGSAATVTVTIASGLVNSQEVEVTLTEPRKLESTATSVTAVYDVTAAPQVSAITADGTGAEVTVANVPAGATVIVYDHDGVEIGRATNNGSATANVTVEDLIELTIGEAITVTISETGKAESAATTVTPVFEQSAAPSALDSSANATTDQVTVPNVPAGAIVKVYDEATGNEIGTATNNGAGSAQVVVTIAGGLTDGQEVEVSITGLRKLESTATPKTAVYDVTAAPSASDITADGTAAEVTVANVPAGAKVIVYDHNGDEIGRGTNSGATAGSVTIVDLTQLAIGDTISVSLHENNKSESAKVTVTPVFERSAAPLAPNLSANATTDAVTVANVPAGMVVKVYDVTSGNEIGTATNSGGSTATITVTIGSGLANSQEVEVTLTESRKLESTATSVTAVYDVTAAPQASAITADGTAAEVTVANMPAGVTVIVYDSNGDEIGRGTNTGAAAGNVTIEDLTQLAIGETISVSLHENNKSESAKVTVTPVFERSTAPTAQELAANATTDKVTVQNVPAGAIVQVYDVATGDVIGTETNNGTASAQVVVTIAGGLTDGQEVEVSITELRKLESTATPKTAVFDVTAALQASAIIADGTAAEVTVTNVPAGATVIVYGNDGVEIGRATNGGATTADVTIEDLEELAIGETISVTLTEENKSESVATTITSVFEQSGAPSAESAGNATTDQVTVSNVPAGAIVKVYGKATGDVIGTATNNGTASAQVVVTVAAGLADGQEVEVTITELRKRESTRTPLTAVYDVTLWQAESSDIVANATANKVAVRDVPAGGTITVRNNDGKILGTAKNSGNSPAEVTVDLLDPALIYQEEIDVTLTIDNHSASEPLVVTVNRQSEAPATSTITVDVLAGRAVVNNVPAGAEVVVYDDGAIIGRGTNTGSVAGEVVIEGLEELQEGDILTFTVTVTGDLESEATAIELALTDGQAVAEAARLLKVGFTEGDTWESVTGSLFLLSVGAYATDVSWTSSKPTAVVIPESSEHTLTADVVRQTKEQSVILTAKIEKNGVEKTRTFLLIVKAQGVTKEEDSSYNRNVQVVNQTDDTVPIPISRILVKNDAGETNSKIDKVILTPDQAADVVSNAGSDGNTATIVIDELPEDAADEIAVEIPTGAMLLLAERGFGLNIQTDYATITLSETTLQAMDQNNLDLFFRLIPLKSLELQSEVRGRLPSSTEGRYVVMRGLPLIIETNYSDFDTTLFISFAQNNINPSAVNLNNLRVYIEHSDGEKVMRQGTIVRDEHDTPIGMSIEINKFSTFTIVELQTPPAPIIIPNVDSGEDVENGEAGEEEIGFHSAYINGYPDRTFRPNRQITRAELAALLARNLGETPENTVGTKVVFKDVAAQHWAAAYIEKVRAFGLIIGDPNGNFRPEDAITRAEMAAISSRFKQLVADSKQGASIYFTDLNGHWAAGAIDAAKSANVMNGYPDGTFKPQNSLTRAEAVATINRLFDRGPLYGVTTDLWSDVAGTNWAFGDIAEASIDHYYVDRPAGGEQRVDKP
ncbi:choice-of-anchor L domain-containing protein [Paenibacillus agaridevorans]|uniref:choice-of-anchor L domain-containing protein n=1 Tax=Paenibacillus agaridevorans TaxID=171404 RepID=UPI001BE3FEDA|nr:choice-of-anchor L domain-containing protein [Paenibacillus agaridevorans]